ncbi:MAG: hypothetical protein WA389_14460 [Terriglobales bacterium]
MGSLLPCALALGQTSTARFEDEEYKVASAALEHYRVAFMGNPDSIVIYGMTKANDHLESVVDRIRHPEPPKPKMEDPALTRPVDPAQRKETIRLLESEARRTRQNPTAFAGEISDETILDWTRRSYDSSPLLNRFQTTTPVFVSSEEDPAAVIRISHVGFNRERTQAVIEVGYATGPESGGGNYVLLAQENGVWKVRWLLVPWISCS